MTIARRFNAAMGVPIGKSPQGRQNGPHVPRQFELGLWD